MFKKESNSEENSVETGEISEDKFVKWFRNLDKNSGKIAGGKGANLAEIYNLKISVPPGFVVTAQAYDYFIEKSELKEKISKLSEKIDYEDTKNLNETTEKIRELIINSKFPKELEEEILESYEHLDARDLNISKGSALDILKTSSDFAFVAVRSSATTEDLEDASFAGQQETFLNIKGKSELLESIKKCFASLFTPRATYYRNKKKFKHEESSVAVVVQKMVNSTKSGVIFSKDPSYRDDNILIEAVFGLGEGIVSGKISPDSYTVSKDLKILDKKIKEKKIAITRDASGKSKIVKLKDEISKKQVLKEHEISSLSEIALKLEEHYHKPQDIEFAIEDENIFIVQTRPITTLKNRIERKVNRGDLKGEIILEGLGASPGISSGKIKIIEDLKDLDKIQKGDVLVTGMTNPDMVVTMQKSAAIVTDEGGMTAHAAIVSREMGIPCIVGTQNATTKLKEGEIITVDGFEGKIYKGKISEEVKKEILPVITGTKTKIKVMIDLPSSAERAAKSKIDKVGLTRMEGIIAESGKHPEYFLKENKIKDYEETIFKGLEKISEYFKELWIRTSDIRSDEFQNLEGAPKEKEANPMLGMHGIRYGIKNPQILKAELNALKRISEKGKIIGILLPQVISVDEVKKVKRFLEEINFTKAKLGVMIETPAAVQLIKDLCDEKIDFISFGTNDLTQYMLAVDRGNEQVQILYNEMHPAILHQLEYVIRVCKRNKIETSICGQAGSKKEMVKFLVEKGIDSISVNPDVASEISKYILEIEKSLIEGTDEEPRQYQPEKKDIKEDFIKLQNIIEKDNASEEDIQNELNQDSTITEKSSDNNLNQSQAFQSEQFDEKDKEQNIEKDIQAIEKEKLEYLEKHPEEESEEFPIINGAEKLQEEEKDENENNIEKEESENHEKEQENEKKRKLDIF